MKKIYIHVAFVLLLLYSCEYGINNKGDRVNIDLDKTESYMPYSIFCDSIAYIELNTNDSCIMSGIENIYLCDNHFFIKDNKRAGILVFDSNGKLETQINYYGNGLGEFANIRSFAIDKNTNEICIYDGYTSNIKRYTYNGDFSENMKIENIIRDFAIIEKDKYLFIMPSYRKGMPCGVWTVNQSNQIQKKLLTNVPENLGFEFLFIQYNSNNNMIYYYDRNWDTLYEINKDSAKVSQRFEIKQIVPYEVREQESPTPNQLNGYAMMANFSVSPQFVMFTFYTFGEKPFKWVLYNRETQNTIVSDKLKNDIDGINSTQEYIFYLNDSTWCRALDPSEDDCNIKLQLLHIKNSRK